MLIRIYIIQQLPSSHKIHSQLMDNQHIEFPKGEKHGSGRKKLNPLCLRVIYKMQDFIKRGIQGEELAELNRYSIYLKATCLSDLVTGYRKLIYPPFWIGKTSLMNPHCK